MESLIDFKKESISIIDEKIRDLVFDIKSLLETMITPEVYEIYANFGGGDSIYTLLEELKAKETMFNNNDKKIITEIETKVNEVTALLKKRVLVKIRYGEIAKWVNSEDSEHLGLIFFSDVKNLDQETMDNLMRIFPNPNDYNFKYTLYSKYYGSFENILEKISKIASESKVAISPEELIRKIKLNNKK